MILCEGCLLEDQLELGTLAGTTFFRLDPSDGCLLGDQLRLRALSGTKPFRLVFGLSYAKVAKKTTNLVEDGSFNL